MFFFLKGSVNLWYVIRLKIIKKAAISIRPVLAYQGRSIPQQFSDRHILLLKKILFYLYRFFQLTFFLILSQVFWKLSNFDINPIAENSSIKWRNAHGRNNINNVNTFVRQSEKTCMHIEDMQCYKSNTLSDKVR